MEAAILSKQIENAQKKVEEQNFVSRKNVLKYDDVMNVQRMVIYEQRRRVLEGADLSEEIGGWMDELVARIVFEHTASDYQEEWDLDSLFAEMQALYETEISADEVGATMTREELIEEFQDDARDAYAAKVEEYGAELMREVERYLVLQVVDVRWREHLESMEYLRDGIHLRAMAQKDPLSEYRSEGHAMFEELTATIQEEVVRYLLRAPDREAARAGRARAAAHGDRTATASATSTSPRPAPTRSAPRARSEAAPQRAARRPRRAPGPARRPRSPRASASSRRGSGSAATTRAGAARARSTRSATAPREGLAPTSSPFGHDARASCSLRPCDWAQARSTRAAATITPWPSAARSSESSRRSGPSWPGSVITFDPDGLRERLAALEEAMGAPGFWDEQQEAARVSSEHARLSRRLERYEQLSGEADDLAELLELASDDGELDEIEQSAGAPPRASSTASRRTRSSAASTTPAARSSPSTPARAAPTRRTGRRSSCACTSAGRPSAASRPS